MIDIHAHYVPPSVLETVARDASYGVRVTPDEVGPRLSFTEAPPLRPVFSTLTDLTQRAAFMDQQGIDLQVVAVWPDLFGYELPSEQGRRWARLVNEAMAADLAGRPRFRGCATVPLQDPAGAAAELAYAVEKLGFCSVMIGSNVNGTYLDTPQLAPFWEAVSDAGVPVFVHPLNPRGADRLAAYRLPAIAGYLFDTTLAAASLIFGGVFDRFPKLRFILAHGGGFLPWVFGRMQHAYASQPETRAVAVRPPADYMTHFYFDSIVHHPPALRYLVDWAGVDRVLVGTDYPFTIGDFTPARTLSAAGFTEAAERALRAGNARGLLRLQ